MVLTDALQAHIQQACADPQGIHLSHIDPVLAPELCPMDHTAGSPWGVLWAWPGPRGWTHSRREDVVLGFGNVHCGIQQEPPAFPSCPTSGHPFLTLSSF